MAKLINNINGEFCTFKDLKPGDIGVIVDYRFEEYVGYIVMRCLDNCIQRLGGSDTWGASEPMQIRILKKGEVIEIT